MANGISWLLLIHQLPPKPLYLRAQVRRRLLQVGALPLKNSVYVLPNTPACLEDFQWIGQEAAAAGGEAMVCGATFIGAPSDGELRQRFQDDAARRQGPIKQALAACLAARRRTPSAAPDGATMLRLQRMVDAAARIDFFASEAGREVQTLMTAIKNSLQTTTARARHRGPRETELRGQVWVTRTDPHIDRLATAWLIRRFVDPAARFRFVDAGSGPVRKGERSFDIVGGDFTHEGERCSFETMCARLGLRDAGLREIAEIVHDLDLKDGKFGRPDASGVQRLVDGLSAAHPDSGDRVQAALPIFDTLFASFGSRSDRSAAPRGPKGSGKRKRS